jgi:hypothetical protein
MSPREYGPGAVQGYTKPGHCGHGYKIGTCPTCDPQAPTLTPSDSPVSDTIERHPAYAQIGASRVSGTAYLYGSDFAHHNFITLTIHASELHRGLSQDRPFATKEYIEVGLSEAQWATFVSSLNVGQGVQCTLVHREGQRVSRLPRPAPRDVQFKGEMTETLDDARRVLRQLRERLVAGKGGKESLGLLDKALQEIEQNTRFVADQFTEHMTETVERAKVEVNAYAQHLITRLGLEAASEKPPLALDE